MSRSARGSFKPAKTSCTSHANESALKTMAVVLAIFLYLSYG